MRSLVYKKVGKPCHRDTGNGPGTLIKHQMRATALISSNKHTALMSMRSSEKSMDFIFWKNSYREQHILGTKTLNVIWDFSGTTKLWNVWNKLSESLRIGNGLTIWIRGWVNLDHVSMESNQKPLVRPLYTRRKIQLMINKTELYRTK